MNHNNNSAKTAGPALKYRIKELLAGHTEPQRLKIKNRIMKLAKINDGTFSRYINATATEMQDIPAWTLRIFAHYLGTGVEDLYNEATFFHFIAEEQKQTV